MIFAFATSTVRALKKATKTIPIVSTSSHPVRNGLVSSRARAGGNITGLANLTPELAGKRLQLLKEDVPQISRVAVIWNPARAARRIMRETKAAANSLDIKLHPIAVRVPKDIEHSFSAMKKERADALVPIRPGFPLLGILKTAEGSFLDPPDLLPFHMTPDTPSRDR